METANWKFGEAQRIAARVAGSLYLLEIVTGIFSIMYVPSQIGAHDPVERVHNLVANLFLFRLDIVAGTISDVIALILPLALYKLFSPVSRNAAVLMVAFAVVFVPIGLITTANQLDILSLLNGAIQQHALTSDRLAAQVATLFADNNNANLISEIYWGLWLLPFGYLVLKSAFLPRVLGFLLMLGCLSYLADFFAAVFFPNYSIAGFVILPATIGEIGTALWLTFIGVRKPPAVAWNYNHSRGVNGAT